MNIQYSSGVTFDAVIQIWGDGNYSAYWCESPTSDCGSALIGYCDSAKREFRTIKECVNDAAKRYPHDDIYRNGKLIRKGN